MAGEERVDHAETRTRLEDERARLLEIRTSLTEASSTGGESHALTELSVTDQHPADVGTEVFERTRDASVLVQVERQLGEIERALNRVDDGTYGICEACGHPVGAERLEARPAARFCLDDQALSERETART